ncbi:MAG: hypothetical protein FJ261_15740, partial [Planctomycetes bacterium]|nr:hypothetical protein [Planctomycetota bacterium]
SMRRVRALAMAIKGSERHHDIFESTRVALAALGATADKSPERSEGRIGEGLLKSPERSEGRISSNEGRIAASQEMPLTSFRAPTHANHPLGLVPLGSLFRPELTPDLNDAPLPNADYLAAIRALVTTTDATGQRRSVDLSLLGAEEIGSVYERLLEIEPVISWDPPRFDTPSTAGNERKTTGSYYTPDSLVQAVLDSALDPVIDAALKAAGEHPVARAKSILALRVCDPACGSGHFLVAAARRLGLRLARARALDHEPSPPEVRDALREVISRCIYGVDINPMAVELCQFALWLEALSPGRPLGFLRHHIRCGNSLMGARADRLGQGIPDDAFAPIEGDDRKIASEFKKLNKKEREAKATQGDFFMGGGAKAPDDYLARVRALETDPEETVADIMAKDRAFDDMRQEATYRQVRLRFDVWCAAFAQRKVRGDAGGITTGVLRRVERNPYDISPAHFAEVRRLSEAYRFFHMEAEFPTVFASGGFDCVLGNPPWERIKLQEQEYFAAAGFVEIAEARNAGVRKKLIEALEAENPRAYGAFLEARRAAEAESQFARGSGMFPLCENNDKAYALFAELNRNLTGPTGRTGFIVPTGIATDDTTSSYFRDLTGKRALVSLFDFENREGLFASVDSRFKFCALTATSGGNEAPARIVCFSHQVAELDDPERWFTLSPEEFELLNPNTRTLPIFRGRRDAEITKAIYRRMPVLWREEPEENPWGVSFRQGLFNMAFDSGLFRTEPGEGLVRLYEAKMLHQFDHRWATYETINGEVDSRQLTLEEKQNPAVLAQPQYWVPRSEVDNRLLGRWDKGWLMGWRDICRNTDVRTTIAGIMPMEGVGNKFPLFLIAKNPELAFCFYANLCAFVFDYVTRQKMGGTTLNFFIIKQFPVLPPEAYGKWEGWIRERVLELVYTATDLEPFARDLGHDGPPFPWDPQRRFRLRCELDALFFRLYGVSRDDAAYIMGTFNIMREKEMKEFRTFRTRDEILRVYDGLGPHFSET